MIYYAFIPHVTCKSNNYLIRLVTLNTTIIYSNNTRQFVYIKNVAKARAEALKAKADIQAVAEACFKVEEGAYTTEDRIDKTLSKRNIISTTV